MDFVVVSVYGCWVYLLVNWGGCLVNVVEIFLVRFLDGRNVVF